MHITVYLGASCGTDPHLAQAVRELGAWIGAAGHTLVYGGSKTGLMGLLAQSALAQGAASSAWSRSASWHRTCNTTV